MERVHLNGIWRMKKKGDRSEYPVLIPGSVLSALLENKAIEDPFDRMNEYSTRELFWDDYEFCYEFEIMNHQLLEENQVLVCEGLDTLADILINGHLVASTKNMHRTYRIPVSQVLCAGKNTIQILFHSPLRYIESYTYQEKKEVNYIPCGCMKGNHLIRKAHSMFGWDWGPQLIDAGIFRAIYIEFWNGSRMEEMEIHQEHGKKTVTLQIHLTFSIPAVEDIVLIQVLEAGVELAAQTVVVNTDIRTEFLIQNPKLWWPNGYGEQPLYQIKVQHFNGEGILLEEIEKNIGLRTLTVSRDEDVWGREFAFQVNGTKIFAMGGNYIPEDCVYNRITRERQEYLVESMQRVGFNCVRVWGGGYYPSDYFYDLCDRYGLIVWQDLMYACNVYDVTEEFAENCRQEVIDNVKRIRHHAGLGLICGNNEIESAWDHWQEFQKESSYLRADYIKLFEHILPAAVKKSAPDIFYWPSSPSSGGCFDNPDSENDGDTHYWAVWHGQLPFTDYKNHNFRFCSEFGFQSFPCLRTVESFARKEDQNIFSRVMESHQKNDSANGKMLYYLSETFRYPASFDALLYTSQILQGMAVKYGVEHWRRHRGRCMGALYWQVNDNWPAPSWSSIDYFGRWKALHYMAQDFFASRAASLTVEKEKACLYFENETGKSQRYKAKLYVKNMQLDILEEAACEGQIDAFRSENILSLDLMSLPAYCEWKRNRKRLGGWEEEVFLEGWIQMEDGTVRQAVETVLPYKYLRLSRPNIETKVFQEADGYTICLKSDCFAAFVELSFQDADVIFSQNYFHITDKQIKEIYIRKNDILQGSFSNTNEMTQRLCIRSIVDTY